ncbi:MULTISPECIES: cation:proton antiporter regulatory subunit [Streptomyces]|uniref:Potassium transporter TrkA n=2 Tax=Streptomyces TaxID=1883 RepID=A0A5N6ASS4_9ACTN|nr:MULTISPECIES: cation:proton antiporter regulatory subunit [Streptomyces]KAB8170970.1 potassium transporter TrkA [Streptomyces mimosae]KAB8179679.1 potassium transporter TrkA [Streptomyces sp. 3MP-14]RMI39152.1 potassium transporter TrkA [Streptomyces triticirhizae]
MVTRRTPLPGVGTQYDLATRDGRHISVVAHDDGRRFIAFYSPDDPDACQGTVPLDAQEAARLASIIAPDRADHALPGGELGLDLVTERIPIGPDSPYRGRPLGDTRARTRTGASIVAVLRRTSTHPSPSPDYRLEAGDTLLVVGTREGVDDLSDIIAGA